MTKKKKYIYINLKNTREDKDLKQKDIAKLIHVSPRTYSHYENNEREMSLDTWKLLSKLLEKSIDYLSIIERNHIIGDIDPKAILDNLVGLYRAETEKKPIFKMDWIDTWVNGQLVQVPKLYETFAPCELKSS